MAGRAYTAVPDGWQEVRLGDVAEVSRGISWARDQEQPSPLSDAVPVVRIGNVQPDGFRMDDTLYIRGVPDAERSRRSIRPTSLVMVGSNGNRDRVGNVFLANEQVTGHLLASFLIGINPSQSVSERFLAATLRSRPIQSLITESTAGSTGLKNLSLKWLRALPILLPPLPEQRAIAAVLDSIDEAIERTEEVIAATERLRDALLHELLTRGLPGHHTAWRDVPGLGTIPADWEVVRLGDVGRWLSGGTPSKTREDYWVGNIPWVSPKDMKTRQISDVEDHISEEGARVGSRVVPAGTIFVVVRGMILAHSFPLAVSRVVAAFNQDIRALVCKDSAVPEFVLAALEHLKPRLLHLPTPSTHGTMRVVSEELFAIPVPLPPLPEQQAIAASLDSVDARIERMRAEREALQSTKASAGDALLTGRVRIPNVAERDAPKATNNLGGHMNRAEVLRTLRAHQATLADQFGVTGLTLFGSVARDQATDASDIDILAEFGSAPGWREYFGAQAYLESVLGRPVDLMTAGEVRPEIRPYVERDAIHV